MSQNRVLPTREPIRRKTVVARFLSNAYRRITPERTTLAILPNRLSRETLGKMPTLPRMTAAPFGQTRQTLPVLLDHSDRVDDSQAETTEGADS
jgi:hypothetical protein